MELAASRTDFPPFQRHSSTSLDAAVRIKPTVLSLRAQVLQFIKSCGSYGATDDEVQEALGMDGSTQRPRRVELTRAGRIVPSGKTRQTKAGRSATVWEAV